MSQIVPGAKYALVNDKGTTCISISPKDHKSIVGDNYHGRPDQKWIFYPAPRSNYRIVSESGKLLSVYGEVKDGVPLVAGEHYEWFAEDELQAEGGIRLSPKDIFYFNIDLENGNPAPGTKVQLWSRAPGDHNQIWVLLKVD